METATQALHRLTSYEPGRDWTESAADPRVLQDLVVNDMSRVPWPYKRYPSGLPRLALPRELPATNGPAIAVLAGTGLAGTGQVTPAAVDTAMLSRLLYWSAGVVRTAQWKGGRLLFRAAGSAGARFPLELYVAVPGGGTLPAGVHWYDPQEHALVQIGPPPSRATGAGPSAPAIVVTGVPWRTGWRYRERGFRHIYWDAGTMLAQLLALADSSGLATGLYSRFPDTPVAALTGADGVHEFPVAVVGLGEAAPALEAGGAAVAGEVDAAPVEFPLVTAAQRAGAQDRLGEPWHRGAPVRAAMTAPAPVEAVIAARGSQRRMDGTRGVPHDLLRTGMDVALRGIGVRHWVAVHDVDGLAPGLYRWPSPREPWEPVRGGILRDELYRVCLDQALARDAAFVVIATADVGGLNDREYREAQLAAGLAEGRLHLAAYALGASASGMTFDDSKVPALLGEPCDGLLFTCVGVPAYKSMAAGQPGAPTQLRR